MWNESDVAVSRLLIWFHSSVVVSAQPCSHSVLSVFWRLLMAPDTLVSIKQHHKDWHTRGRGLFPSVQEVGFDSHSVLCFTWQVNVPSPGSTHAMWEDKWYKSMGRYSRHCGVVAMLFRFDHARMYYSPESFEYRYYICQQLFVKQTKRWQCQRSDFPILR